MTYQPAKIRKIALVLATLGAAYAGLAAATALPSASDSSVHPSSHHVSKSVANRSGHHNSTHNASSHTVNKATHTANNKSKLKTKRTNVSRAAAQHSKLHNSHASHSSHAAHAVAHHHGSNNKKHATAEHHAKSSVHHAHTSMAIPHHAVNSHHHHPGAHHIHHATQPIPAIAMNNAVDLNTPTADLADSASTSNYLNADSSMQTNIDYSAPPAHAGQRLVSFVHKFMASLRYTHYKSGGEVFDITHGVYEVDCSHYVNHILQDVFPRAYTSLEESTGAQTPNSANYYDFFSHLSSNLKLDWNRVDDAKELQPGDILVFRYLRSSGAADGGHVMLVMNKPTMDNGALLVQVSDSAFAGHGDDTRHGSGVGIGTLKLKIDPYTGQPSAYAWEQNSPWQNRVNIAMGRPVDMG